uniref:Putative secreted protein n=1 Tax=Ixodes ricinus TaxID=34613 RepID=A0A6B0U955_IXORI
MNKFCSISRLIVTIIPVDCVPLAYNLFPQTALVKLSQIFQTNLFGLKKKKQSLSYFSCLHYVSASIPKFYENLLDICKNMFFAI